MNKLEEEILKFIVKYGGSYSECHVIGYHPKKGIIWGERHSHRTYNVWYEALWHEFVEVRKIPKKKLCEAVAYLELKDYIYWDNGYWKLTDKGKLFCGIVTKKHEK